MSPVSGARAAGNLNPTHTHTDNLAEMPVGWRRGDAVSSSIGTGVRTEHVLRIGAIENGWWRQPEIEEHFAVGKECVVFRDEADLLEKIDYYLSQPDQRCAIALAGQRRTLSQHLYSHRLQTLLSALGLQPAGSSSALAGINAEPASQCACESLQT